MALGAAAHHSAQQHAAPRSQRTGTRAGEGEVFESRESHPGERPAPLLEVRPQGQPERHTVGSELVLDPVVPQMAEKLVEVVDVPAQGGFGLRGGLQGPLPGHGLPVQVENISPAPAVISSPEPVVESIARQSLVSTLHLCRR